MTDSALTHARALSDDLATVASELQARASAAAGHHRPEIAIALSALDRACTAVGATMAEMIVVASLMDRDALLHPAAPAPPTVN